MLRAAAAAAGGAAALAVRRLQASRVAARRAEARYRGVVDTAVDAILSIDERGRIDSCNPAAERLFGYQAAELVGRNVSLLMPEPDRSRHDGYLRRYVATGEAHVIGIGREVTGRRRDGSEVPLHLSVSEVVLPDRRLFTGILRDITDERLAALRAEHLRDLAAAVSEALGTEQVAGRVVDGVTGFVAADGGELALLDEDDGLRVVARVPGGPPALPVRGPAAALPDPVRGGGAVYAGRAADVAAAFPGLAGRARAAAALPLVYHDAVIGALVVTFTRERAFPAEERRFLETAASIAAGAVERALLYDRDRRVAETLQRSLLPPHLPEVAGASFAAEYLAGAAGLEVGGDWYDVLPLPGGRVGLVIGDVAGRGVRAATTMGRLRHSLAAVARLVESPAEVLARVNDLLNTTPGREMATCCYAVVDGDGSSLRYASAGHPPALLLAPGVAAQPLDGGRAVPLGVTAECRFTEAIAPLPPGATLLFYTDGLVERRSRPIDDGVARLAAAADLAVATDADPDALCRSVLDALLHGDEVQDDVAVLVARFDLVTPAHLDLTLPGRPEMLAYLRGRLRGWLADLPDDDVGAVLVAAGEAVTNAMRHGYPPGRPGPVRVRAARAGGDVTIEVTDRGRWRDPPEDHDGRGLALMRALVDGVTVDVSPAGTRVHLRHRVPAAAPV